MLTSSDFKELLKLFEKHEVRYLIVGGYAVMKYSEPRFTKNLNVWIAQDYFYQMGKPPLWVDIMMSIPGVEFEEAWKNREMVELDDIKIPSAFLPADQ